MTGLRSALERYLSMRQGLGYKYQHQARRLSQFVSFMEEHRATTITTKLAVAWATLPPDRHASWALRLTDARGFARHVANIDPETEVPPAGILPRLNRAKPYAPAVAGIAPSALDHGGLGDSAPDRVRMPPPSPHRPRRWPLAVAAETRAVARPRRHGAAAP
jgi:hypothetical protein